MTFPTGTQEFKREVEFKRADKEFGTPRESLEDFISENPQADAYGPKSAYNGYSGITKDD